MSKQLLYWLDLETTGLDPNKDVILEVAIECSPFDNPLLLSGQVYESIIKPPQGFEFSEFIRGFHGPSGLLDDCVKEGADLRDVESDLLAVVPDLPIKPILAGSSVHFDLAFLRVHMPALAQRFSHRLFDVSAFELCARAMGMPESITRPKAHSALADICSSQAHYAAILEWFRVGYPEARFLRRFAEEV